MNILSSFIRHGLGIQRPVSQPMPGAEPGPHVEKSSQPRVPNKGYRLDSERNLQKDVTLLKMITIGRMERFKSHPACKWRAAAAMSELEGIERFMKGNEQISFEDRWDALIAHNVFAKHCLEADELLHKAAHLLDDGRLDSHWRSVRAPLVKAYESLHGLKGQYDTTNDLEAMVDRLRSAVEKAETLFETKEKRRL